MRSLNASLPSSRAWRHPPRLPAFMCGIVGYVGKRPVQDILVEGLRKLEYRGYDSAGISIIAGEEIESVRAVGNLSHLDAALHDGNGGGAGAAPPPTPGLRPPRRATPRPPTPE